MNEQNDMNVELVREKIFHKFAMGRNNREQLNTRPTMTMVNGMRRRNNGDIMGKDERLEQRTTSTNKAVLS